LRNPNKNTPKKQLMKRGLSTIVLFSFIFTNFKNHYEVDVMNKIFLIILTIFILLLSVFYASAFVSNSHYGYSQVGYYSSKLLPFNKISPYSDFLNSNPTTFNNEFDLLVRTNQVLGSNYNMILSSNKIDSNLLTIEVIVYDEPNQRLAMYDYSSNTASLRTTYALGSPLTSYFQLFDLNNDGIDEIIYSTATGLRMLRFNESINALQLLASNSAINIVSISCFNASGYYNNLGVYQDNGLHCAFMNASSYMYELNASFNFNYLPANMKLCDQSYIEPMKNNIAYPLLISNIDNDNYIEYTTFCKKINTYAIGIESRNANNILILNDTISEVVSSNQCINAGLNDTPLFLSVINYNGYDYGVIYGGIYCDAGAFGVNAQQYQNMTYRILDRNNNIIYEQTINGGITSCTAGNMCNISSYVTPLISDIISTDSGDEFCFGVSVMRNGIKKLNDTIYCYGDTQSSPYYTYSVDNLGYPKTPFNSYFMGIQELSNSTLMNNIIFSTGKEIYQLNVMPDDFNRTIVSLRNYSVSSDNNYYFTTLNNDNYYDVISINGNELIAYLTDYTSSVPEITGVIIDTGSPICINNNVNYKFTWNDNNEELVRIRIDCSGHDNYTDFSMWTSQINTPIERDCYYNETGIYSPIAWIENSEFNSSFALPSMNVIESSPPNCYISGQIPISSITSGGGNGLSVNLENILGNLTNDWSFATKFIFGLIILLSIIIIMAYYEVQKTIIAVVSVITIIGLVAVSFFPLWLFFLIVVVIALGLMISFVVASKSGG
jgi:hypothetical protein